MTETHPPKDRPWYHVLVDGEEHTTYVSEDNLSQCNETASFEHPLLKSLFRQKKSGNIKSRLVMN